RRNVALTRAGGLDDGVGEGEVAQRDEGAEGEHGVLGPTARGPRGEPADDDGELDRDLELGGAHRQLDGSAARTEGARGSVEEARNGESGQALAGRLLVVSEGGVHVARLLDAPLAR